MTDQIAAVDEKTRTLYLRRTDAKQERSLLHALYRVGWTGAG